MKSCVVVTSVIAPSDAPLSYTNKRSVYSAEERYMQTLQTVESVKMYIPESDIVIVECSPISKMLHELSTKVDVFLNLYPDNEIRKSPHKGVAEAKMLLSCLSAIDTNKYDSIFKLTGRYLLNKDFNYTLWKNDAITLKKTNFYSGPSIHTFLYKFNKNNFLTFKNICNYLVNSNDPAPTEQIFYNKIKNLDYINIEDKLGVTARWSCYTHIDMF